MNPDQTNTQSTSPMGTPTTPAPMMPEQKSGSGMVITLAVIVVVLLVLAYVFMMKNQASKDTMMEGAMVEESSMMIGENGQMMVDPNTQQGASDDVNEIEADLNATDLQSIEADLEAI